MTERRTDDEARDRIAEIHAEVQAVRSGYRSWSNKTLLILALLVVVQLGLGVFSVTLLSRQGKADQNSRRIDRAVCAEVHYLERGLTLTEMDPNQSVVHNELQILVDALRPLTHNCPPAPPLVLPDGESVPGLPENPAP